jgi:hypothetical protein
MSETRIRYQPTDRLTRQQAADHVGISVSRLAQLRRAGKIDYYSKNPVTRAVRYLFRDVDALRRWREGGGS